MALNTLLSAFKPAKTDGTLPLDEAAGQFRYRKAINWEVPLLELGIGSKTAKGGWTLELTDPDGVTTFKQSVQITLFLVALGVPGLVLFTWNFQKETITTTIAGGETVTAETLGHYLLGGTVESEQGDLEPASGQSSTDIVATIDADWLSPVYVFSVVPGTKAKITKDAWEFGGGDSGFSYAFGAGKAVRGVDSTLDAFGDMMVVRVAPNSKVARIARIYRPLERFRGSARGGAAGAEPSLLIRDDGLFILGTMAVEGYIESVSNNDGIRFERALYPDAQTKKLAEMALFPKGSFMPQLVKIQAGRCAIAIVGTELVARIVRDGGGFGSAGIVGGPVKIMKAATNESYSLTEDKSGALWVFDSKGTPKAVSRNGGSTWSAVGAGSLVNV